MAPTMLFSHPPPKFASIAPRIDTSLDDEAAGAARKTFAEEAARKRAEEAARVKAANLENRKRLASIKAKTDDGDDLLGGGSLASPTNPASANPFSEILRERLRGINETRERWADAYLSSIAKAQAAHRELRLASCASQAAQIPSRTPHCLRDL